MINDWRDCQGLSVSCSRHCGRVLAGLTRHCWPPPCNNLTINCEHCAGQDLLGRQNWLIYSWTRGLIPVSTDIYSTLLYKTNSRYFLDAHVASLLPALVTDSLIDYKIWNFRISEFKSLTHWLMTKFRILRLFSFHLKIFPLKISPPENFPP